MFAGAKNLETFTIKTLICYEEKAFLFSIQTIVVS